MSQIEPSLAESSSVQDAPRETVVESAALLDSAFVEASSPPAASSSEGSLSHEERSKTPDSGPNEEFEAFSEVGSRTNTSQEGSPQNEASMVEFVADDFLERIRQGGIASSSVFNLAPVDPRALQNLEQLIHKLCENIAEMNTFLTGQLQQMCQLTAEHVRTYRSGIEKTCDNVDTCIKTMYQLMARTEEVHRQMGQISQVHDQIKNMKQMVTILEGYVDSL